MFKTLSKINNLFKEINENIKRVNTLDEEILILQDELTQSNDFLKADVASYIIDIKEDIASFGVLNNDRSFFGDKDYIIDFKGESYLDENTGFQLDIEQGILLSERNSFNQFKDFAIDYDFKNFVYHVTFEEVNVINFLQFVFIDLKGNPISPNSIYFNDDRNNNLYETWMNKLQRNTLNDSLSNTFYMSPKTTKKVSFHFKDGIDTSLVQLSFLRNNYNLSSSISYKVPFGDRKGFVLYKNDYDNFVNINYEYSINGIDYNPIKFSNTNGSSSTLGRVLFYERTPAKDGFLWIKTTRGSISFQDDNTKITQEQDIINSIESRIDTIGFQLNFASDSVDKKTVSIIVPSSMFDLYEKDLPNFFQQTVDGLIEIKTSNIKYVPNITEIQKLTLKNQNSISAFKNQDPVVYFTDNNRVYMSKLFATNDINFLFSRLEETNIFEPGDYTPIVFDITIDTI